MNKRLFSRCISIVLVVVMVLGMTFTVAAEEVSADKIFGKEARVDASDNLSEDLINYVAITSAKQELSDKKQVVIGIGDGNKRLSGGVLTYKNTSTNEIYQVSRDEKIEDAMSFSISYDNKSEGVYQLVGLEYTIDGKKSSIALKEVGLDASWGVGVEYNANPDEVIPVDTESGKDIEEVVDVSFEVTTDEGKSATASSISKALEEASGGLSVEGNGVVKTKETLEGAKESVKEDAKVVSDTGLTTSDNSVKNTGAGNVVIVLDPGHGGSESGAIYGGLVEKDVNLKVASYCKAALEQYGGVTVYMTRYGDDYVGLAERTDIAKNYGANAFVSIHMNSGGASGVEVWYPNYNWRSDIGDIGYNLSGKILNNIVALGLNNRGLKVRNSENGSTYPDGSLMDYYSVIHNSKERGFPGIIVEHAFMDGDYGRLQDENFLRQLGEADAKGIAQYYGLGPSEDLSQYAGAFDANIYRYFNADLWTFNDQQCFNHWIECGIWEGRDGSPVFNMSVYMLNNPDLVNAFGFDFRAYARHFNQCGMSEGRKSIDSFSVRSYKNRYKDLRQAFGNNLRSYYMHYISCGMSEGRETTGYDNKLVGGGISSLGIFDFSDIYDYEYYSSNNPDLIVAFGNDDVAMLEHFANCGMNEGRRSKESFSVYGYKNRYLDLRRAFGNNLREYYGHYLSCGKREGRNATYTSHINGEYEFVGVNFSPVYEFNYYQEHNPDVRMAFGDDDVATFLHFLTCGMREGRQASEHFTLSTYATLNPDLFVVFGFDLPQYYMHYLNCGRAEGRIAV